MNLRKTLLALAVAGAAAPAAFANDFVGGELGYVTHPVSSPITREQVRNEYLAFRQHPVLAGGIVLLQGEAGYVQANQAQFADQVPAGPHSHVLGNSAAATASQPTPAAVSEWELRAQQQQYLN